MSTHYISHVPEVIAAKRSQAAKGLADAAEFGLEMSNRTVPVEEATLARSGSTSVDEEKLIAVIAYDTPYARRQHEAVGNRHSGSGRAKWLELTLDEQSEALNEIVARALRD